MTVSHIMTADITSSKVAMTPSAHLLCIATHNIALVSSKAKLLCSPYTSIQAINFLFSFFFSFISVFLPYYIIPGFLKTGLAKISTHSTSWQFKTRKLVERPIKSVYLTPGCNLMVPRSIPTSPNLK